jgi:hypothetical protein
LNQKLSEERATAVAQYLRETEDVPMRRILVPAGYGATHLFASSADLEDRPLDRRVDINAPRQSVRHGHQVGPVVFRPGHESGVRAIPTMRYYGIRLKALFTRTLEGLPLVAMSISGTYVQALAATRP